jgi:hypothetical protein
MNMIKTLVAAAATATVGLASFTVLTTSPANAAPCTPPANVANSQACHDCFVQANIPVMNVDNQMACMGIDAPSNGSTGYPDCDQYQIATHRALCVDQHLTGQR